MSIDDTEADLPVGVAFYERETVQHRHGPVPKPSAVDFIGAETRGPFWRLWWVARRLFPGLRPEEERP